LRLKAIMEMATKAVEAAVPRGKAFWWFLVTGGVVWASGWGSAMVFGEYRQRPATREALQDPVTPRVAMVDARVTTLSSRVTQNTTRIEDVAETMTEEMEDARRERTRMMCLLEVTARREVLTPGRCP